MINSFLFGIFLLFYTSSSSQTFKSDSIRLFVDTSIELIRSNAVDTSNIKLIGRTLYTKSQDILSVSELTPLYSEVFKLLKDHRGGLKNKVKTFGWNRSSNSTNNYLKNILKIEKPVVTQILDKKTAYIRIMGNDDFAFERLTV